MATCDDDAAGLRDRALLLIGFAGALRRSELCGIEVEHITWKQRSLELLLLRSKTDAEGECARIGIPRGKSEATCPVRALRAWLDAAEIEHGPAFRAVSRHGSVRAAALGGEAVRLIVLRPARLAGIKGSLLEPQRSAAAVDIGVDHSTIAPTVGQGTQRNKTARVRPPLTCSA